jgi:RimJ/RimL family protein N-acetyltransferase
MISEKIVSISQFEQLMKSGLKESFEDSVKDLRGHCVSYENIVNEAAKDKRKTKIALTYDGSTVISTARLLCPDKGRCEINMVYTNPKYRNKKICQENIKLLIELTSDKYNIYTYELDVETNNESAIKCYKKNGFIFVENTSRGIFTKVQTMRLDKNIKEII